MWISLVSWVSPVVLRTQLGVTNYSSDISALEEAPNILKKGLYALGGRCDVSEEELAAVSSRLERYVKLSAVDGLRKLILMN